VSVRAVADRRDAGFTLVESVVATALFGIFAATLLTFVTGTFRLTVETQRRVTATHVATQQLAEARERAHDPGYGVATVQDDAVVRVQGVDYVVERTWSLVDAAGDDVCAATHRAVVTPSTGVLVTVTVSWADATTPVEMTGRETTTGRTVVLVQVHDDGAPVLGVWVGLRSASQRDGSGFTETWSVSDVEGCTVFDVTVDAGAPRHYWYVAQGTNATLLPDAAQHVHADWRYSSAPQYLGRIERAGRVHASAVEVRREATLRVTLVDAAGRALTGAETEDVAVTVVALDGLGAQADQVRSTAEITEEPTQGIGEDGTWRYPMRHRDLVPADVWWESTGVERDAPVVSLHPADVVVPDGGDAELRIAAAGEEPLEVRWQVSADGGLTWADVADESWSDRDEAAEQWVLTVPAVAPEQHGERYRALVHNDVATAVTGSAAIWVDQAGPDAGAPELTVHPVDRNADAGETVTFEVAASGDAPMHVRWQRSTDGGVTWSDVAAGDELWTYETPALASDDHDSLHRAVVSNPAGTAISEAAALALYGGPREFTLRGLWPSEYALWIGDRPRTVHYVRVDPGESVQVLLSPDRGVVAVRDSGGTVTVAPGVDGAGVAP
jgi:prepilin-type N-terminal cleavage/methylation domain-containing protein